MSDKGFLRISRCIIDHWIYQDAEYFKVWFEMLFRARYSTEPVTKLVYGQLVTLNRGEFIFGRQSWSKRLGISEQRLRTLIDKLIQDNMIEVVKKYNKFTIYRIVNYEKYNQHTNQQEMAENQYIQNSNNLQTNQQTTYNQPTNNLQVTTKEESNKVNKVNKDIYILTEDEKQFLDVLSQIENYPLDRKKDIEMYHASEERYPELNLIEAINQWRVYKLDKPLTKKSNPRSQINTAFRKYIEWGKCLKKGDNNGKPKRDNGQNADPYAGIGLTLEDLQDL